jgi:hypothetical protein
VSLSAVARDIGLVVEMVTVGFRLSEAGRFCVFKEHKPSCPSDPLWPFAAAW